MAKKAATKKTAAAKTPKKSIAPSPEPPTEHILYCNYQDGPIGGPGCVCLKPLAVEMRAERTTEPRRKTPNKSIAPSPNTDTDPPAPERTDAEAAKAVSRKEDSTREPANTAGNDAHTPPADKADDGENAGDDRFSAGNAAPPDAGQTPPDGPLAHARIGETRGMCWERLRKEARAAGLPKGQGPGTAYEWATRETDRLFPPPVPSAEEDPPADPEPEPVEVAAEPADTGIPASIAVAPAPKQDDQGVSGLGDLPPSWPELPANAQLQVEIAWVTANRLRVRDGTGVNLARALSPAPSYSALSWLETSILFPAKFADISVKATASSDDEREHIRREKLSIEEMRSILAEMLEARE